VFLLHTHHCIAQNTGRTKQWNANQQTSVICLPGVLMCRKYVELLLRKTNA